jgi:hypothetical protein
VYRAYLATMHTVVRSAVPLLEAALDEARCRRAADPLAAALEAYYAVHVDEERGHDVWLLEDLEAAGGDVDGALRAIPAPPVAAFVGAQYYWLRHYHPVSLLGHIAVVEGYHPPAGFAARLQGLTGFPRHAFGAIARHERLDVHHKRDLVALLDRLPLSPAHEQTIGVSALHTMEAGVGVLAQIYDSVHGAAEGQDP